MALTRETILHFSDPISPSSVDEEAIYAESEGVPVPAMLKVSSNGLRVTLFYLDPLPDGSSIRVFVEGDHLVDSNGQRVDANSDGQPGGRWILSFSTQSLDIVAGTKVCGRVLASKTAGDGRDVPLEGVTISVDGLAAVFSAVTDRLGNYCLDPAPSSRFFVHIDGSTAANTKPSGSYYPTVGKAFEPKPGLTVHAGESYLPLIVDGTLQALNGAEETSISLPPSVIAERPELAGAELTVPENSLFFDDGSFGGSAGIAPVPSDRLPGNLPQDLDFPLVLTVQTDGATNFDTPAPICFPNLSQPDTGVGLPAGSQQSLVSFDHDAGRWRSVGGMTVTADAQLICSNPGVGIVAPGWHLPSPPPVFPPPPAVPTPPPGPHPPHNDVPETPDPPSDPPEQPEEPDQCPGGAAACSSGCDSAVRACGYSMLAIGTACAVIASAATVPAPALGLVLNLSCGGVFGTLGIEGCASVGNMCESSCDARCGGGASQSSFMAKVSSDPILDGLADLTTQILEAVEPYRHSQTGIPEGVRAEIAALLQQANDLAGGDAVAYLNGEAVAQWPEVESNLPSGNAPHYPILYLAEYLRDGQVMVQRGETGPYGQYTLFPAPGAALQRVRFYDPYTHSTGIDLPVDLGDNVYGVSRFFLYPVDDLSFPDFDGDTLPDEIEVIYGSNPTLADTDGDGATDREEIIQGTDLLGRDINVGEIIDAAISLPGELDRYRFGVLSGQRIFMDYREGGTNRYDWILMDSEGTVVFDRSFFIDGGVVELTRGGTYTLYLGKERSTNTGTYSFQLWDVPPADVFDIAIGELVSDGVPAAGAGNIETPGREDVYRFSGTSGQMIFADLLSGGTTGWDWILEAPDGRVLFDRSLFGDGGTHVLPLTGFYTLTIGDPRDDFVGAYSFRIWDVPPTDVFDIVIGELVSDGMPASGAGNIETPGREDVYRFSGTSGQMIFADLVSGGTTGWDWILEAPDGRVLFDRSFFGDAGTYVLPLTGVYTLTIGDPRDDFVGAYSFRIWDVPPADVFDIAIGELVSDGVPASGAGNIETPGREDVYRFSGTSGQMIFADLVSGGTTGWDWILEAPDGSVIFDRSFFGDAGTYALPLTGVYTLSIGDPRDDFVGAYSFQLIQQ